MITYNFSKKCAVIKRNYFHLEKPIYFSSEKLSNMKHIFLVKSKGVKSQNISIAFTIEKFGICAFVLPFLRNSMNNSVVNR